MNISAIPPYIISILAVAFSAYTYKQSTDLKSKLDIIYSHKADIQNISKIDMENKERGSKITIDGDGIHLTGKDSYAEISASNIYLYSKDMDTSSLITKNFISVSRSSLDGDNSAVMGELESIGDKEVGFYSQIIDHGSDGRDRQGIYVGPNNITVRDEQNKTRAVMGSVSLSSKITGGTRTTSPSSLTLFGKDGTTILQLPGY